MKTDLYTKIILTIIAVALTINLVKNSITPAMADNKKYASIPLNADGSLNVHISKTDGPMEVNIKNVDRSAFYYVDAIPVKIKP